jgi:DNA-binding beta-propeller fold protein YncE
MPTQLRPRASALLTLLATVLLVAVAAAPATAAKKKPATREILAVSNNWDGTADLVDPRKMKVLTRIDIIPDRAERMAEIQSSPDRFGYFLAIRQLVGEGHDQFVDDGFTSPDGRFLYVSRPSFADVVAISLRTRRIVWRVPVEGYRADHMAISRDGRRLLVSASTARKVHVIDTQAGKIVGSFESGDQPHENNFSQDESLIFHASIGTVYTPMDDPAFDGTKGDRWFEVVDAKSLKVLRRIDMGEKLAAAGYPDMSAAVRPMAISPDERFVYFQLSFLHGFVEYDLKADKALRVAELPLSEDAKKLRRDEYLLDSAHHGLAMNPDGTKLCVAGTMSDYAAIVSRATFGYQLSQVGHKPYWATNSADGRYCFVSVSGDDRVAKISYRTGKEVSRVTVGDHPQRMRTGVIRRSYLR